MTDPFAYSFDDAFYGPLGEYARRNEAGLEIDSLSLLLQLLGVTGVAIGPRAFAKGGQSRHSTNLFTLIVGTTSVGKGCSGEVANRLGEAIDPGFKTRTSYNVASAPALVELVTDGLYQTKTKRTKQGTREETQIVRPAIEDKRHLLFLPEMGSTLVAQNREGATLRDELKNAWDGRTIENNKYNYRERATNPHIGLIGHITPVDLKLGCSRADVGNGYLNRFLITEARRVRSLPFYVPPPDCTDLIDKIRGALSRLGTINKSARSLDWGEDARDEWASFYEAFHEKRHPFIADVAEQAGRLHSLVLRVSLIYAVLDESPAMHLRHLRAAKATCFESLNRSRGLFCISPTCHSGRGVTQSVRDAFAGRKGQWSSTDLHTATSKRFSKEALHTAAAELVASGEWIEREGKAGNGHAATFWSLPAPLEDAGGEVHELVGGEQKIEKSEPSSTVLAQGIHLKGGAPVIVRYNATALTFNGQVTGVKQGQAGQLACLAEDTPDDLVATAHQRLHAHPSHFCVIAAGEVLFVPKKAVELAGDTALPA